MVGVLDPARKKAPVHVWVSAAIALLLLLIGAYAAVTVMLEAEAPGTVADAPAGASKSDTTSASPSPRPRETNGAARVVDPSVKGRGLVPEPITQDPKRYAAAAMLATATFDTTRVSREEFGDYLASWLTEDPWDADPELRAQRKTDEAWYTLRDVVLPEYEWESLASEYGSMSAALAGDVELDYQADGYDVGRAETYTAEIIVTFTRKAGVNGDEGESSYEEKLRVAVHVLCGGGAEAAAGSRQTPEDCRVLRFLEPPYERVN